MNTAVKDATQSIIEKMDFTKEELSTFNLCLIEGCSYPASQPQEEVFVGFYH